MSIIKNLILRNKLRNQLNEVEQQLRNTGYYEKEKQLCRLIRKPDQYGELYMEIDKLYGNLVRRRNELRTTLQMLTGINLFKKHDDFIK